LWPHDQATTGNEREKGEERGKETLRATYADKINASSGELEIEEAEVKRKDTNGRWMLTGWCPWWWSSISHDRAGRDANSLASCVDGSGVFGLKQWYSVKTA
jgi:hypothetical protein